MKQLSNEEKAKEFATSYDGKIIGFARIAALQMAQWKDEQHEQEKQQLIDNLCEVLPVHMHGGEIDEVLAELDEKMKGE